MTKSTGCCAAMREQDRQQGVQGLLLLLLRATRQGSIVGGQREREEGGKEGHGLSSGRPYCTRNPSSLLSFCSGTPPARSAGPPAPADRSADTRRCSGNRANTGTASATPGARWPRVLSTCTRRDLPMPASPLSSTTCPPPLTCAQRSSSSPTSCSGPPAGSGRAAGRFQATAGHSSHTAPDRPPAAGRGL